MHHDRIRIIGVGRHFHPRKALAAVLTRHHADDTVGDDDAVFARRMDQDAVDVALARVWVDCQLGEAFAEIVRILQRADLDTDPQPVAVKHDVLDMTDARRRRERPMRRRFGIRNTESSRQLSPRSSLT